jgi:hypothetical protein
MMIRSRGIGRRFAAAQTKRGAMKKQIALATVLAVGAGTVALAETAEEQQACTNDAFALCQNYIPDRNRVFSCLVENRNQLSVPCHTVMLQYFPPEPVAAMKKPAAPAASAKAAKTTKSKGPLSLAPQ